MCRCESTRSCRNAQREGGDIASVSFAKSSSLRDMKAPHALFNREYFFSPPQQDGNIGRGRFELRKVELDLAREFAV